jgi:hypothetical protein
MSPGPHAPHPDRDEADRASKADHDAAGHAARADRASSVDDASIVPGLGAGRPGRLDLSRDPDRFDAGRAPGAVPEMPRDLDPDYDPDRFSVASRMPGRGAGKGHPGEGSSLPDLLGTAGTHEGHRDNYEWAYGLLAVLIFLGLVSFLFNNVLSP